MARSATPVRRPAGISLAASPRAHHHHLAALGIAASLRRNPFRDQFKLHRRQFNEPGLIDVERRAELDQVQMPALEAKRSTIFLDHALDGACSRLELDDIPLLESMFRHGCSPFALTKAYCRAILPGNYTDRKSTRLNSSH